MVKLFICLLSFAAMLNCFDGHPTIPEEVKTAHKALQKLQAATETGIDFIYYKQALVEAKTAVNIAESKLPAVTSPKIVKDGYDFAPEYRLESIEFQMQKTMDAYISAGIAWQHHITNKKLSDSPEGNTVLSQYNFMITSETDEEVVIQKLWDRADKSMKLLMSLIEK